MKIKMYLLLGMFHFVPGGGSLVPRCPYWMTIQYVFYLNRKKNIAEMNNYAPIDFLTYQLWSF